jgi:DHA2 family multidrug resistance protein
VLRRFWLSTALHTATVMHVLDITIVSVVALTYMAGTLSADKTQISWVVSSYLVVAVISTPLLGSMPLPD